MVFWDRPLDENDNDNYNQQNQNIYEQRQDAYRQKMNCKEDPRNQEQIVCENKIEKFNPQTNQWDQVQNKVEYFSKQQNPNMLGRQFFTQSFQQQQNYQGQELDDALDKELEEIQKNALVNFENFANSIFTTFPGFKQIIEDGQLDQNKQNPSYNKNINQVNSNKQHNNQQNYVQQPQNQKDDEIYDF